MASLAKPGEKVGANVPPTLEERYEPSLPTVTDRMKEADAIVTPTKKAQQILNETTTKVATKIGMKRELFRD